MKEPDIRKIVRDEIAQCFVDIKKDIELLKQSVAKQEIAGNRREDSIQELKKVMERVERYLIGDAQLQDIGLAERARFSYEYARKNVDSKIIERAEKALDSFEFFGTNKDTFVEIVDKYKILKWIAIFTLGGGLISFVNLISLLVGVFSKTNV